MRKEVKITLWVVGIIGGLYILGLILGPTEESSPRDSNTTAIERELRIKADSYGASSSDSDIQGACNSLEQSGWRYSGEQELQYRRSMSSASRTDHTVDSIAASMDYSPSRIRDYCNSR